MKEIVTHLVWHFCEFETPKESGRYFVSHLYPDYGVGFVDTALYLVDVNKFDKNEDNSIHAWAELPDPV